MAILSWFKRKINAVVDRVWKNDWFFHKFYEVYTWFSPNAVAVKQYHFGKSWLAYLTGKTEDSFLHRPRYSGLDYNNTPIDTPAVEVITRGLIKEPVKKLEFDPLLITDAAVQILGGFLERNQSVEEFGIVGGTYNERTYSSESTTITDNVIRELGTSLKQNKRIRKLKLDFIGISETGWSHIADLLEHNAVIEEIVLSRTEITVQAATQLTKALKKRGIKTLSIVGCTLNDEATAVIADYLAEGAKVNTVSLANNGIQADGLKVIAGALKSKKIKVKKLDLSGNSQLRRNAEGNLLMDENDHVVANESGIEAIFDALIGNKTLEAIVLFGMGVERILVMASAMVEQNTTLKTLNLGGNTSDTYKINPHRITPLAIALTVNKTLESIDLAGNSIDTEDLQILSQHMGGFSLKHLNLRANNYCGTKGHSDEGLKALATGIRNNRSLVSLDLGRMNIEHQMHWDKVERGNFILLGNSIAQHPTLRTLSLNNNLILGRVVVEMLLHPQCKIEHLDCGNGRIQDLESFIKHVADNPAGLYLATFDVNIKHIREDLRKGLYEAIKPINAYRREMLRGYYAFMMVGNKDRFGKEHPTKDAGEERKLRRLPQIPADVGRKISEYADYRRPLKLL